MRLTIFFVSSERHWSAMRVMSSLSRSYSSSYCQSVSFSLTSARDRGRGKRQQLLLSLHMRGRAGRTLSSRHERLLRLRSRLGDDLPEVVLLALERVEQLALEHADDQLVEVLDVSEEDWRERRVKVSDEVGSLALVDTSVVSRCVSVEVS